MVRSASSVYVKYGFESAFQGGATKVNLFGKEQKASGLDWKVGQQPLGQLNTPEVKDFLYGRNEGNVSMEYVLSNPWFFSSILHDYYMHTESAGVHTYKWSSDPTLNANIKTVKSINLEVGIAGVTTPDNVVRNAKGVICPTLSLRSAIDQPVSVSQSLIWGKEDAVGTTLNSSIPTDSDFSPYNFVSATLELPNGTVIANVQDFDVSFDTGATLLYQMGSPNASSTYNKILNMTGKINLALLDKTNLNRVVARTPIATLRIFITNGLAGVSLRSIDILFTSVGLSAHRTSGLTPAEVVLEDFDYQAKNVLVTAKNATAP